MTLHFATNVKGHTAVLGTLRPVHPTDLKRYIRMYPIHWITA